jgi:hypothetical protein
MCYTLFQFFVPLLYTYSALILLPNNCVNVLFFTFKKWLIVMFIICLACTIWYYQIFIHLFVLCHCVLCFCCCYSFAHAKHHYYIVVVTVIHPNQFKVIIIFLSHFGQLELLDDFLDLVA